ncbi:ATP-binding cassette, subfamily B, bacterial [Enterococcus sp. AZ194]|uniref:ABC transporter ATP-binding protein n=1 Tax=Enterococcus sp. AZ194 TaxID=2774629 RepID=UPI003F284C69
MIISTEEERKIKSIKFFISYCWLYNKKYVLYTFLYQLVISILPLLLIVLPKFIIDELVNFQRVDYLFLYVSLLLGYQFLGGYLANALKKHAFIQKSHLFISFQSELTRKMATADFEKIESAEFLDHKEKASKFLYGNGQGFGIVFDNFAGILGNLVVFLGIIGIISTLNIYLLGIFILLSIVTSYFDNKTKQKYVAWDMEKAPIERRTTYLINVIESFQYAKEIRIFDLSSWLTKKVDKHLSEGNEFYTKQVNESVKVENIGLLSNFLRDGMAYVFLIAQFLAKKISIGDFTMYMSSINTFSNLLKQVLESLTTIRQYESYFEALSSYMQIPQMNTEETIRGPQLFNKIEIKFEDVWFKYPNAANYSLKQANFKINSGDKVAIVGENGAGKTTLIKLICRLYKPTKGRILMNGLDIQKIDHKEFTQLIATVFQDFKLFSFSLRDNLVFENKGKIPDFLICETLKNNGFDIEKYENGLDTSLYKNFDEKGFEPSGGEGQKIVLSRAELKQAPIIILDEPTAAMDPKAEMELYTRFNLLTKNKTTFFISHRLASTKFCDYIFCLNNGEIIEKGTHEELLKAEGLYSSLYFMQSELYAND